MESRLKILGHPVHPMLVMFPLALLATGVIFDLVDLFGGPRVLGEVAYWNISVGFFAGLVAAVAGTFDLLAIPAGTRAKRVAVAHALTNAAVLLLFGGVWVLRTGAERPGAGGALVTIEVVALAGLVIGAWFGGELVDRLGVGVDSDAHLDAPSSLRPGPTVPPGAGAPARPGRPAEPGQLAPASSATTTAVDELEPVHPDVADPAADRELHRPDTGLR
jgi:uncharacterized membrane protein